VFRDCKLQGTFPRGFQRIVAHATRGTYLTLGCHAWEQKQVAAKDLILIGRRRKREEKRQGSKKISLAWQARDSSGVHYSSRAMLLVSDFRSRLFFLPHLSPARARWLLRRWSGAFQRWNIMKNMSRRIYSLSKQHSLTRSRALPAFFAIATFFVFLPRSEIHTGYALRSTGGGEEGKARVAFAENKNDTNGGRARRWLIFFSLSPFLPPSLSLSLPPPLSLSLFLSVSRFFSLFFFIFARAPFCWETKSAVSPVPISFASKRARSRRFRIAGLVFCDLCRFPDGRAN